MFTVMTSKLLKNYKQSDSVDQFNRHHEIHANDYFYRKCR